MIKRKFADRPDWTRVLEKRFSLTYIDNKELEGYLAITYIDKVNEPLVLDVAYKNLCLADNGYIWTQYFPKACNYSVTTMFNEKQEIIQLYFDVCNGNMVSPSGIPYYDDLYLDVVLLSTGEVLLFDEDELEEALGNNDIAKEQYDLAYFEAKKLIKYIENNKNELLGVSKKYLDYMISLK
jgi:predicted RNA-binding protein associated with RNAse of E/G family